MLLKIKDKITGKEFTISVEQHEEWIKRQGDRFKIIEKLPQGKTKTVLEIPMDLGQEIEKKKKKKGKEVEGQPTTDQDLHNS